MKMTKEQRAAKKAELKATIAKSIKTKIVKGERKSEDGPIIEVKPEYVSFTKWLKGAVLNDWTDAKVEQAEFNKALGQDTSTRGGIFVPTILATELIPLLKESSVVRQMPVRTIPFRGDKMQWNAVDAGPAISWGAEAGTITEDTTMAFGTKTLEKHKAICLYKMSRELLQNASPAVDSLVKAEVAEAIGLEEDLVFLQGEGGIKPTGIYNNPRVQSTDLSAVVTIDNLMDAQYRMRLVGYTEINGWIAHPRTVNTLRQAKDANGRYLWTDGGPGAASIPNIHGAPLKQTTKIAITMRPSSNESYMIGGVWNEFVIGDDPTGIRIETSEHRYFETDQLGIKFVKHVGSMLRQPARFVVIKGIQA